MANSGYKDKQVVSYIKLRFSWSTGTPNIANNFTPLNWTLQLISTNSSAYINSTAAKSYSVTVDGQTWSGTNSVGINGNSTRTLASGSKNIYHSSDGTKSFNFNYSQAFAINYSGSNIPTQTDSGSGTLDTIPRASVLGTISNFTIDNTITIPITKYNTSFADTINIYVGSTWIKRIEQFTSGQAAGTTVNKSVSFTSSEITAIYNAMPNVTSASFRFVNSTYSGPNIIGTSTKTATGTIASTIKPSVSISIAEAVTGIASTFGAYIQNKSKIAGTITTSNLNGSSIESYSTSINGVTYSSRTFTTDELKTSGSNSYSVTVTDSRGRTATTSGTFNVVAYTSPTIASLSVVRCNQDGTPNDEGTYAKVNASASITSLSNLNTKNFRLQYKQRTSTTWTTNYTYTSSYTLAITNRIISGISNDYPYDFRILASDYFETDVPKNYSLSAGQPILDVKDDGKGLGIFKVSSKNAIELGKDAYDKFDTRINNGLAQYNIGGVSIDPNTTLEELILTSTNTPDNSIEFWYIKTFFTGNKITTSNRTQMAIPYSYNANVQSRTDMYMRMYVSGIGWSSWKSINQQIDASDYMGTYKTGKDVREQGWITITPTTAGQPRQVILYFKNTYKTIPSVTVTPATGVPGTQVLGCSTNGITKTSANIVLTRTNTTATSIYFEVKGEIV